MLLLAGVVLLSMGGMWLSRMSKEFDASSQASTTLDERFGKPSQFGPSADGAVPPDRMEAFLAVRDATAPTRTAIAGIFAKFPTREEAEALENAPFFEKITRGFGIARTGMELPTTLGEFFRVRDETLLAQEMGMGEYSYIYVLVYHTWLGHPPVDGPLRDGSEGAAPVPAGVQGRIHDNLATMLENQAAALPAGAPQEWRDRLAAEIAALKEDATRIPWKDGLPEAIAASFAPYRDRLEASYVPATNLFELARNRKRGAMQYTSE